MIDIYLLSTLLFAALVFIRGKNPLKNGAAFSVALLVIATALRHHYSDFSVVKLAFILYTFSLPTEHLNNKNHEQLIGSAHFFMLTASLFVVFNQLLSAVFLTIVLLVLACASLFIDIAKREKERIQAEIILLCGIVVTIVSSSFYNQYFGIFIMCVHLALRIMLILKAKKVEEEETEKRLEQLENSFHRQLRQETRKISRGLENRVEEIEEKSMRDPLTKVLNRSIIEKKVQSLIEETTNKLFSIALIDLDNFKTVNDTLGHVTGDKCLLNLTEFFMKNKRRADLFGRFGGDEFVMVMPNLSASEAIKAMEFHRKSIEEKSNPHFTVTSGIATYPYDGSTFDELIASADHALYMAKDAGKNKVYYTGNYK